MRVLGVDYGETRIGLALSDPLGWTAQPQETISEPDRQKQLEKTAGAAKRLGARKIVVGFPRRMDGSAGARANITKQFADDLAELCGLEVVLQDERLSSAAAHRALDEGGVSGKKRKTKVDKIAAVLILQTFLDSNGGRD